MLHGPAAKMGDDKASRKKAKLGIILFLIYASLYAAFVIISLVYTELMSTKVILGLNLAVTSGVGLIVLAMVMGFVYSWICTNMENTMNKEAKL
ncbi:MAG: DUF485 domain-containing protein [Bacteroidales bacterium]